MNTKIFDIETVPQNEERLLALAPEFTAPANLKDPVKIEEAIAKRRADYLAAAALNWKTAEVVLIGAGDDKEFQSYIGSEKQIISDWLQLMSDSLADGVFFGGHNIKGFDLPMLVNRARVHRLKISPMILEFFRGRAQWHENIFDTLEILSFSSSIRAFEGNGVEDCARAFGLPGKLGHGGEFPTLWNSDREAAIAYNRRDVEIEIEIARVCGMI